ncbi:MAG TPA: 5-(carboxyamino)imidazole ribonucleotide synthase [Thermodesulfobacteriota bacterium]
MRIGILGGGQLGRMLALAGYPLGLRFRVLDPAPEAPAGDVAPHEAAPYADEAALSRFAEGLDVVTYEFENVPVAAARALARRLPVRPAPDVLEAAQDRLVEKRTFEALGIPIPPFAPVDSRADLDAALARIGLPAVLKARRGGYDGKGQAVLRDGADVEAAWRALGGSPLLLEGFVPFERELSVLAARGLDGDVRVYPLVENVHRGGVLRRSLAPAPSGERWQAEAERYARAVLARFDYVGVLAIELFEASGRLLANEMAPRVHNSGHWTIEGAETSQFEQHVRAVAGLPLGAARPRGHAAMLNLVGGHPDPAALLRVEGLHLHLYRKAPRPGRKIGHVTLVEADAGRLAARLASIEPIVAQAER